MEIIFATAQGEYQLGFDPSWSLADLCWNHRLPRQSMSFYGASSAGHELIVGQETLLEELIPRFSQVTVQPDRNINYSVLARKNVRHDPTQNSEASADYSFQDHHDESSISVVPLRIQECRDFVFTEVTRFLECQPEIADSDSPIVVGISGGGDSNTFLDAFTRSPLIDNNRIVPVMMLGVPDWDLGKERAVELCERYGLPLRFVEAETVTELIGKEPGSDWVTDFEKFFPDADLEVLGTLGIRLSLMHVAREVGSKYICTGLNLEDLLADALFNVMKKKQPLPFPIRRVSSDIELIYPLYRVPKKILDGCNPKYSLQNYQDRYPSMNYGRGVSYYLTQMIHGIAPGIEFDLLDGFAKISEQNTDYLNVDSDLGLPVIEPVPLKLRKQWKEFIGS